MGFIESEERRRLEMEFDIEEIKRSVLLVTTGGKDDSDDDDEFTELPRRLSSPETIFNVRRQHVCVTSGVSFLGSAIVNCLLRRGYSVKIIVHSEEEMEELRELESLGEIGSSCKAVMAKLTDVESLMEAFEGCGGVFHTSTFVDPAGLSGYTKSMAEIEVKASENVMMACSRTPSIKNCVLTSSLLACIWRDGSSHQLSPIINHESWSDESLCIDKKLWHAWGKVKAEKAAWRIAKEKGLSLASICPALITGPDFLRRNPTATIAYLKGGPEMFAQGLLATINVKKLAEAEACVFEAMNRTAFGRYICFDNILETEIEAEKLAHLTGMPANKICGSRLDIIPNRFELSNKKLLNLMSRTPRNCYNQS